MGFELPPLPSFQTNIPQPQNPVEQYGKMLQLKSLMGQQQLQPYQLQEAQQKTQQNDLALQQQQLEMQSQQAMVKAWSDPKFLGSFTGTDTAKTSGVGFDPDAMTKSLVSHGVLPKDALALTNQFVERSQKLGEIAKNDAQAGEANATIRAKTLKEVGDALGAIQSKPVDQATEALDAFKQKLVRDPKAFPGMTQDELAHLNSMELGHLGAAGGMLQLEAQMNDFHKGQAEAAKAQQGVIPAGATMSPEMQGEGAKEVAVAKATQPLKIQTATAEAQAKQLMEGMTQPGYAFNPATGQTQLTDKTAYLQSGGKLQAFRSVGEKDVREDTMLTNRLGDVHQKVAEYEQALQKPVSDKDQSNIAALLGVDKTKLALHPGGELLGALKLEVPMDRIDAALNKENLANLSANARDQLVAYKNVREAMMGYKTVLSGSARGSDKSMDLLTDALPNPAITDSDFSSRSMGAFKQNLRIVGQGLPVLPGIKTPAQIEAEIAQGQNDQTKKAPLTPGAFDWNSMPQHQ